MGEDSCRNATVAVEKKSGSVNGESNCQRQQHTSAMSSCSEADSESTNNFGDATVEDENDQDYQYGPGIVSKLRTKFLSISMRQSRGLHSSMRRSCSLENMLEQKPSTTDSDFSSHNRFASNGGTGCGNAVPPWSNLKRAKSVDTLLLGLEEEANDMTGREFDRNVDVSSDAKTAREPKLIRRRDGPLNRPIVSICDEELPKPDTVKTYKRMFEPADSKKANMNSNVRRRPPVLRATGKSNSSMIAKSGSQINGKMNGVITSMSPSSTVSTKHGASASNKSKFSAKETTKKGLTASATTASDLQKNESKLTNEAEIVNKKVADLNKKNIMKNESPLASTNDLSSNGVAQKQRDKIVKRNLRAPKYLEGTDVKPPIPLNKPTLRKSNETLIVKAAEQKTVESTSSKDLVKSVNGTAKKHTCKSNTNASKVVEKCANKLEPVRKSKVVKKESKELELVSDNFPKLECSDTVVVQQECQNKPLLNGGVLHQPDIVPTSDKQHEDPVPETQLTANATSAELKETRKIVNGSATGGSNTMIFDFRGKDVVSHLAVLPTPFGCKAAVIPKKRTVIIDGKESVPFMNGFGNGVSCGGGAFEDSEDEDFVDYSVPLPCGLVFEGENVRVGKGALLSTRNKDLKIHFEEDVDKNTFVYPSESSLLTDDSSSSSDFSSLDNSSESSCSKTAFGNDCAVSSAAKLRANTAINSNSAGGLMSYTPSVLRTVDNFQPGLFRAQDNEDKKKKSEDGGEGVYGNGVSTEGEEENQEGSAQNDEDVNDGAMLKPADPEFISSWSLSATTSDLLF